MRQNSTHLLSSIPHTPEDTDKGQFLINREYPKFDTHYLNMYTTMSRTVEQIAGALPAWIATSLGFLRAANSVQEQLLHLGTAVKGAAWIHTAGGVHQNIHRPVEFLHPRYDCLHRWEQCGPRIERPHTGNMSQIASIQAPFPCSSARFLQL